MDSAHAEPQHTEWPSYCCRKDYIWVKFESASEIREYYEDAEFAVAFQINKALFVEDIASKSAGVPAVEHFQLYYPAFTEGANINAPADFSATFIYLNKSDARNLYLSTARYDHKWITLPCVYIDNEYYLTIPLRYISSSGDCSEYNVQGDLGNYYDAAVSVMETGKYSVEYESGAVNHYGLILIEDFVNCILK